MPVHSSGLIRGLFLPALATALLAGAKTAAPQSEPAPARPGPCIIVSEIEVSSVVSNVLVALKMRDGRQILVHLDNSCPQLYFHRRFAFRAQGGELCAGRDTLVSRSGEPCRIVDFKPAPDENSS